MSHLAQVRAEQDVVFRDSLAGSSLSALTVVVATMLLSLVLARPQAPSPPPGPEERPEDGPRYLKRFLVMPEFTAPITDAFRVRATEHEPDLPVLDEPPPIPDSGGEGLRNGHGTDPGLVGTGTGEGEVRIPDEVIPPPDVFTYYEEMPKVVHKVAPEYPELPRGAGMEGTVLVRIFVSVDGRVKRAEIEGRQASVFDEAALAAVRQWVFTPAKANDRPVGVWLRIPIVFTLD